MTLISLSKETSKRPLGDGSNNTVIIIDIGRETPPRFRCDGAFIALLRNEPFAGKLEKQLQTNLTDE